MVMENEHYFPTAPHNVGRMRLEEKVPLVTLNPIANRQEATVSIDWRITCQNKGGRFILPPVNARYSRERIRKAILLNLAAGFANYRGKRGSSSGADFNKRTVCVAQSLPRLCARHPASVQFFKDIL